MNRFLRLSACVLVAAVAAAAGEAGAPDPGEGVFRAKGCGDCHSLEAGSPNPKGPPLWFAGSKFRPEWLGRWLAMPDRVRPLEYGGLQVPAAGAPPHRALPPEEAKAVAGFLAGRTGPGGAAAAGPVGAGPPSPERQSALFSARSECRACHRAWDEEIGWVGGFSGPVLAGAGERLQPAWVLSFLRDPRRYEPDGRMPNLSHLYREGADLQNLAAAVAALPGGPAPGRIPEGIEGTGLPADASPPRSTFLRYCAQCHGPDGRGTGPNGNEALASLGRVVKKDLSVSQRPRDTVVEIIRDGGRAVSGNPVMPSWSGTLSAGEIDDLAGFVISLRAGAPRPPPRPETEEEERREHGGAGAGGGE